MSAEINQFNLSVGLINKYKHLLHYNSHWHQIVVENTEGLDRDAVLRTLIKHCHPLNFIPVCYAASKNTANFLLKNCGPAIQKLCTQNLIVANPFNKDKPFKITIKLCFASSNDLKINIQSNVMNVLNKRFNSETGVLNLEHFAKDSELEEYCALSQPKLFFYILHIAKNIQFKYLKLSHNDIEILKPMDALEGVKTSIIIDLRNNNVKDIAEIANMKHLNILELWLDGNPICDNYNEITYGKAIKDQLGKLERLDGVNVQSKGFLPFRRNFICNLSGYDLVDQFLEHYFSLYDAQNRSVLGTLYHKDALFSLTSMYIPLQTTSSSAKLSNYKKVSRNLKQMSDFSKNAQCLFLGPYPIMKVLSSLPVTEHDPYSFTVDLIMYTEKTAVLVVCGVFRECSDSLLESDRLLGFTRTFVLLAGLEGEYSIVNEMLHVTNATSIQASRAFKQTRVSKPQFTPIPQPQNTKEQLDVTEALKVITGLKTEWARKCLEECSYDMKEALSLFIELFKIDKIPKTAFISEPGKNEENIDVVTMSFNTSVNQSRQKTTQAGNNHYAHEYKSYAPYIENPKLVSQPSSILSPLENMQAMCQFQRTVPFMGSIQPNNWQGSDNAPVKSAQPVTHRTLVVLPIENSTPSVETSQNHSSPDDAVELSESSDDGGEKEIETIKEPKPGKRSKKRARKKKRYILQQSLKLNLNLLDKSRKSKDNDKILESALKLLTTCDDFTMVETLFMWYYKRNPEEARQFQNKVMELVNLKKYAVINVNEVRLITAKCEYFYGDKQEGEDVYRKLMSVRSRWTRPIMEFCRCLLLEKNVKEAKRLLESFMGKKLIKKKILIIAATLNKEFNVKIL